MNKSLCFIALFLTSIVWGQSKSKPKLVVGIVVDQMVVDYLYRFDSRYSKGGLMLMRDKGTNVRNAQYNYIPTYTGPGHASIYTGTTPNSHGIVANDWYDRSTQEEVGCVNDSNYFSVGSESNYGLKSPKNLKCMTITDQMKMTRPNAKVISVSLKDRGAILPGGHLSNGSYWYDYMSGHFITSEFYVKELPKWAKKFNNKDYPIEMMKETWSTLFPIETYTASGPDDSPYEVVLTGKTSPTFPYDFKEMSSTKGTQLSLFTATPWANTYVTDFALEAFKNEKLGQGSETDFLCISYSTPDIAGHAFGPQSVEIEDMYLRLDLEIEKLISQLKKKLGENVLFFLTADHAVVPVPEMLADNKIPGGYLFTNDLMINLHDAVKVEFGADVISILTNNNIYLNEETMEFVGIDKKEVEDFVAKEIRKWPGVQLVMTSEELSNPTMANEKAEQLKRGYDARRSGNVIFALEPGYLSKSKDSERSRQGTSHGSGHQYDTHVPLMFYGMNVPAKEVYRRVNITDITPTLSMFLNLQHPNCSEGEPIIEIFKK